MVKHIILWKLKEGKNIEEVKKGIKEGLEGLVGVVPGLIECHVELEHIESSTADLMLDTTFESSDALKAYKNHPAHVEVANSRVRPNVEIRLAYDYEI